MRRLIRTLAHGLLALSVLGTSVSLADEVCADWETQRQPELAIPEIEFTLDAATQALNRLAELAAAPSTEYSFYAEQQALIFLEGWLLRKAAIAATNSQPSSNEIPELAKFCTFLVEKGYYYD